MIIDTVGSNIRFEKLNNSIFCRKAFVSIHRRIYQIPIFQRILEYRDSSTTLLDSSIIRRSLFNDSCVERISGYIHYGTNAPDLEDTRKISIEIMNLDKEGTSSKKQENNVEIKQKRKTKKAGTWKLTWKKKEIKDKEIGSSKPMISSTSMLPMTENL